MAVVFIFSKWLPQYSSFPIENKPVSPHKMCACFTIALVGSCDRLATAQLYMILYLYMFLYNTII